MYVCLSISQSVTNQYVELTQDQQKTNRIQTEDQQKTLRGPTDDKQRTNREPIEDQQRLTIE